MNNNNFKIIIVNKISFKIILKKLTSKHGFKNQIGPAGPTSSGHRFDSVRSFEPPRD